jgi:ribulose-phosphate 3-epimerase
VGHTTRVEREPRPLLIAPSILAADYGRLADEIATVRPAVDWLHVDIMDGHFVPNLSIGPPVVASLRRHTDLLLDCHLMVTDPGRWLEPLREAGADGVSFHVELGDPTELLARIRAMGFMTGLVLDGPTPFEAVEPYLDLIDLLLVMTIKAGFGGQALMPETLAKVARADRIRGERALDFRLQVDGGINADTAPAAARAGADVLVSGTGIFGQRDPLAGAREIRRAALA